MIRLALLAVVATAVLTAQSSASPGRVGVGATEFHLVLSRSSVQAGRVVLELQNGGEDVHDLRLRRIGGMRTYTFPLTRAGARSAARAEAASRPLPPLVLGSRPRTARNAGGLAREALRPRQSPHA